MAAIDRLILCDCAGSMTVNAETAAKAAQAGSVKTCSELCGGDIELARAALSGEGSTLIACGQMAGLFGELFDEIDAPGALQTVDIRDRAGWTDDKTAFAKQAALLAEARLDRPATPVRDIVSEGTVMVLGDFGPGGRRRFAAGGPAGGDGAAGNALGRSGPRRRL